MHIKVEFLSNPGREPVIFAVSRVPCVDEMLVTDDECFTVRVVMHLLDPKTNILAIVRVKG